MLDTHMAVMDHRIVSNLEDGQTGWVTGRSLVIDDREMVVSLNGLAHLYEEARPGVNVEITRRGTGYFAKLFPHQGRGYYPFYVSQDQLTGIRSVNLEDE